MRKILFILLLFVISCKTTKQITKEKVHTDSVTVTKHNLIHTIVRDNTIISKSDTGLFQVTIETFKYGSNINRSYLVKRVEMSLKQGKNEVSKKMHKADSTALIESDSVNVTNNQSIVHRDIEKKGISLWYLLLLIPIVAIILAVKKYWGKIKLIRNFI